VGVEHEYTWIRRRNGRRAKGEVIANVEDRSGEGRPTFAPVVEYDVAGKKLPFTSKYGDSAPHEKEKILDVILSGSTGAPEVYTFGNRFLFTFGPIAFGIIFILIGIGITPSR